MRVKSINPLSNVYKWHLVAYTMTAFLLGWGEVKLNLLLIHLLIPTSILFFIFHDQAKKLPMPKNGLIVKVYRAKKPGVMWSKAFLALALLFYILACIVGRFFINGYVDLFIVLAFSSIFSLFISIYLLVSTSKALEGIMGEKTKNIFKVIIKFSWLIVFFISYSIAKNIMMDTADITFESAATKFTVIIHAWIWFVLIYSTLFYSFSFFLSFADATERFNIKGRVFTIKYTTMPMVVMTAFFWLVAFVSFNVNLGGVFDYVTKKSLQYDTRDTFFCNDSYMSNNEFKEARFLRVSDGDYRMFVATKYMYDVYRLKCNIQPPYYKYILVKSIKTLDK